LYPGNGDEEPVAEAPKKEVAKKPAKAPAKKPAAAQAKEETPAAKPAASNTAKPKPAASNTRPARANNTAVSSNPGQVTALTDRTNNFYIVIASFVDEDLAMDHSNELAAQGKSPTIIPPFGNAITTRVAIKGYGSIAQAQNELGNYQAEYGQDIWILKY